MNSKPVEVLCERERFGEIMVSAGMMPRYGGVNRISSVIRDLHLWPHLCHRRTGRHWGCLALVTWALPMLSAAFDVIVSSPDTFYTR